MSACITRCLTKCSLSAQGIANLKCRPGSRSNGRWTRHNFFLFAMFQFSTEDWFLQKKQKTKKNKQKKTCRPSTIMLADSFGLPLETFAPSVIIIIFFFFFFFFFCLLTARVVRAPEMISQSVSSIFSVFYTALWDLANSRPVHFLMLHSHLFCFPCLLPPFTVPCEMVFGQT